MSLLYPLKFTPIIKEKIWGGNKLQDILSKDTGKIKKAGESWEISSLPDNVSVVNNGFLQGNDIEELIEVYLGDLVGDNVYNKFGNEFPLLIKFIDANDYLSIQVHPDDTLAGERHNCNGKTEMWYIVDAEKDAELIVGFNKDVDKGKFVQAFGSGMLRDILNFEKVKTNDVFYLPAGRIHATGPGILFAEIQQSSDITYRIYDWDRLDENGESRDLHVELAINAIDFSKVSNYKTSYNSQSNKSSEIVKSPYFVTNKLELNNKVEKDYYKLDSFIIYMAIEGEFNICYNNFTEHVNVKKGETVLVPAVLKNFKLEPVGDKADLLEIYIPE